MQRTPVGSFLVTENGTQCVFTYTTEELREKDWFYEYTKNVYARSAIPDWATSKSSFSLQRLTTFLKRQLNMKQVEIRSSVLETGENLILKIFVHGGDGISHESIVPVDKAENIEDIFADALLLYLAPDVSAYTKRPREPEEVDDELFIAEEVLQDVGKATLVKISQMWALMLRSRTLADRSSDIWRAYKLSVDIEQQLDAGLFRGNVDAVYMSSLTIQTDFMVLFIEELLLPESDRSAIEEGYVSSAKEIYERNKEDPIIAVGYIRILMLFERKDEAVEVVKQAADVIENREIDTVTLVLALNFLLDQEKVKDAQKIFTKIKEKANYYSRYDSEFNAAFDVIDMRLSLTAGDIDRVLMLLASERLEDYPCLKFSFVNNINIYFHPDHAAFKRLPDSKQQTTLDAFNAEFQNLENIGLRSFDFYNAWGSLLSKISDYDGAASKYEETLNYPGDHEWSYLNWGSAKIDSGDYEMAVNLYRKSLEFGTVPNAVYGFLEALSAAGNSRGFMQEYLRYREKLEGADDELLRRFSILALTHTCRLGETLEVDSLVELNAEDLARFDRATCVWSD